MRFTNRAAGVAAAMLIAFAGIVPAGPSRAWELTAQPNAALPTSAPAAEMPEFIAEPAAADVSAPAPAAPALPVAELPADEPEGRVERSLPQLVAEHASAQTASTEHECLANAVYFESKGESLSGQLSVAEVVLNRARSGRFPSNVCGVVKQRGQFSFVRGGRLPSVPRASAAWRKAVAVAHIAIQDLADSPASRALFFHARRVKPGWRGLTRVATVGNHIFYR